MNGWTLFILKKQLKYCNFSETEMYEKLVLHYANNLYDLKKNNNRHAVLEMRKCIAATFHSSEYSCVYNMLP